ncbi:uncharacterized protein VTP21DRAFT_2718 [Calcarisporiella thermophila]|uniref:uncharacterized protein n=1 Tax=Calcarisporiella thermophila TaxID=911321 RepID=UPI0037426E1E
MDELRSQDSAQFSPLPDPQTDPSNPAPTAKTPPDTPHEHNLNAENSQALSDRFLIQDEPSTFIADASVSSGSFDLSIVEDNSRLEEGDNSRMLSDGGTPYYSTMSAEERSRDIVIDMEKEHTPGQMNHIDLERTSIPNKNSPAEQQVYHRSSNSTPSINRNIFGDNSPSLGFAENTKLSFLINDSIVAGDSPKSLSFSNPLYAQLLKDHASISDRLTETRRELEQTKQELERAHEENMALYQQVNIALKIEDADLELVRLKKLLEEELHKQDEARSKLKDLQSSYPEIKSKADEFQGKLEDELKRKEAIQAKLHEVERERKEMESSLPELQASYQKVKSETERLKSDFEKEKKQHDEVQLSLTELRKTLPTNISETEELRKKIEAEMNTQAELRMKLSEEEKCNGELQEKIAALQKANPESQSRADLQEQIGRLVKEKAALEQQVKLVSSVNDSNAVTEQLKQRLAEAEKQQDEALEKLEEEQKKQAEMRGKLEELRKSYPTIKSEIMLREELDQTIKAKSEIEQRLSLYSKIEATVADIVQLEQRLSDEKERQSELRTKLNELRRSFPEARTEAALREQLATCAQERDNARELLSKERESREVLADENEQLRHKLAEQQKCVELMRMHAENANPPEHQATGATPDSEWRVQELLLLIDQLERERNDLQHDRDELLEKMEFQRQAQGTEYITSTSPTDSPTMSQSMVHSGGSVEEIAYSSTPARQVKQSFEHGSGFGERRTSIGSMDTVEDARSGTWNMRKSDTVSKSYSPAPSWLNMDLQSPERTQPSSHTPTMSPELLRLSLPEQVKRLTDIISDLKNKLADKDDHLLSAQVASQSAQHQLEAAKERIEELEARCKLAEATDDILGRMQEFSSKYKQAFSDINEQLLHHKSFMRESEVGEQSVIGGYDVDNMMRKNQETIEYFDRLMQTLSNQKRSPATCNAATAQSPRHTPPLSSDAPQHQQNLSYLVTMGSDTSTMRMSTLLDPRTQELLNNVYDRVRVMLRMAEETIRRLEQSGSPKDGDLTPPKSISTKLSREVIETCLQRQMELLKQRPPLLESLDALTLVLSSVAISPSVSKTMVGTDEDAVEGTDDMRVSVRREMERIEEQLNETLERLREANSEREIIQNKNEQIVNSLSIAEKKLSELQGNKDELEEQLRTSTKEREHLSKNLELAQKQLDALRLEKEGLQVRLDESNKQLFDALKNQETLEAHKGTMLGKEDELQKQVCEMRENMTKILVENNDLHENQKRQNEINASIIAMIHQMGQVLGEEHQLKIPNPGSEVEFSQELLELETLLQGHVRHIYTLVQEHENAVQTLTELERKYQFLKSECSHLKQSLDSADADRQRLLDQLRQLESSEHSSLDRATSNSRHQPELQAEVLHLRHQVQHLRQEIQEQSDQTAELDNLREELQRQQEMLVWRQQQLEQQRDDHDARMSELDKQHRGELERIRGEYEAILRKLKEKAAMVQHPPKDEAIKDNYQRVVEQYRMLGRELWYCKEARRRELGFRMDLAYQKRFLMVLIGGVRACTFATEMFVENVTMRRSVASIQVIARARLKKALRVVLAVSRMKLLGRQWTEVKSMRPMARKEIAY